MRSRLFLLAFGLITSASAGSISPELLQRAYAGDNKPVGMIVRFHLPNTTQGRAVFKELRQQLNQQLNQIGSAGLIGDALKNGTAQTLWLDQSIYLPLSPVQARSLATFPFVAEVFENFKVQAPRTVAKSQSNAIRPWYLEKIGAPALWNAGWKGQGVRVGHLDSGIDVSHPDLQGKILAFQEFDEEGKPINSKPHDTTDHGTHTAGLIVGQKTGVAPEAKLISALVLPNDEGTFAQVIAGMQYVLDPDNNANTDDGAHVVNMSLGIPGTYDQFLRPVENMLKAGVAPVFAIGNFGPGSATTGSPGNIPDAIGVGAVDQQGKVASFSSRGPVAWQGKINGIFIKPDLAAPGTEIISTIRGGYGARSGSSQASPLVAGGVALLLSAKPKTSIETLKQALYTSASHAHQKNNEIGFGVVNFPAAAQKLGIALATTQPVVPPSTQTNQKPPIQASKQPTAPDGYTLCAIEGGTCHGVAHKEVAFGTAGRYIYGTNDHSSTLLCTLQEWGNHDPAFGVLKGCFVKNNQDRKPIETKPAPAQPSKQSLRILLVDNDAGKGSDVTNLLRDAIKTHGRGGAFVWNTQQMGAVPLSELRQVDVVIWATGENDRNTISAADQQTLFRYLQGGGKLIVTGQDIGYDIGQTPFYQNVLASRFVADSSGTPQLETSSLFGKQNYMLNAPGSGIQYYPDVIESHLGSQVVGYWATDLTNSRLRSESLRIDPNKARAQSRRASQSFDPFDVQSMFNTMLDSFFSEPTKRQAGAIVAYDARTYKTLNLGFGLEGLAQRDQTALLGKMLDWLMK